MSCYLLVYYYGNKNLEYFPHSPALAFFQQMNWYDVQSVNEEGLFLFHWLRLIHTSKKLQPLLVSCRTLPETMKQYMNGKNHTWLDMKNGEDRGAASIHLTNSNKCILHNVLTCYDKTLSSSHNYYQHCSELQVPHHTTLKELHSHCHNLVTTK